MGCKDTTFSLAGAGNRDHSIPNFLIGNPATGKSRVVAGFGAGDVQKHKQEYKNKMSDIFVSRYHLGVIYTSQGKRQRAKDYQLTIDRGQFKEALSTGSSGRSRVVILKRQLFADGFSPPVGGVPQAMPAVVPILWDEGWETSASNVIRKRLPPPINN